MWRTLVALPIRLCVLAVGLAAVIIASMPAALPLAGASYVADALKIGPPPAPLEGKVREGLPAVHARDAPVLAGASYLADAMMIGPFADAIDVTVQQGLLTVHARDAPVADVLRVIGEKAGFTVTIKGDLGIPVTDSFAGVRLDKAIERLVGEHSWTMIYGPSEPGRRAAGPSALQVYARRARDTGPAAVMQPTVIENNIAGPDSSPASLMDSILKDLAQPERDARMRAIGLLGRLKDEDSIDILIQVLLEDQDAAVRRHAVLIILGGACRSGGATCLLASQTPPLKEDFTPVRKEKPSHSPIRNRVTSLDNL